MSFKSKGETGNVFWFFTMYHWIREYEKMDEDTGLGCKTAVHNKSKE